MYSGDSHVGPAQVTYCICEEAPALGSYKNVPQASPFTLIVKKSKNIQLSAFRAVTLSVASANEAVTQYTTSSGQAVLRGV